MSISKGKAIQFVEEKISEFEEILEKATYDNRYNEAYNLAYYGTEALLTELFSHEEAMNFRSSSVSPLVGFVGTDSDYERELQYYEDHVRSCIAQLKVYRERVQSFWPDDTQKSPVAKERAADWAGDSSAARQAAPPPFVSMSFDKADQDINGYVTGILDALQIPYSTGKPYSKESVPAKIRNRILDCGFLISIFVKRGEMKNGGYTAPPWLFKELGIAQGAHKDVIAWVERGIEDVGGLNYEKEIIYFERDNVEAMNSATTKFLEALKYHVPKVISGDGWIPLDSRTRAALDLYDSLELLGEDTRLELTVRAYWPRLLEAVKSRSVDVVTVLKDCNPGEVEGGTLILEARAPFHKEKLESSQTRKLVEEELGRLVRTPLTMRCRLSQ